MCHSICLDLRVSYDISLVHRNEKCPRVSWLEIERHIGTVHRMTGECLVTIGVVWLRKVELRRRTRLADLGMHEDGFGQYEQAILGARLRT